MIVDLMVTFWQPVVVAVLILIGFLISKFDGQGEKRVNFEYAEMPIMRPILIDTATKKFWGSIWLWLTGTRRWEIVENWYYFLDGEEYVIEKVFSLMEHQYLSFSQCGYHLLESCLWVVLFMIMGINSQN